MAGKKRRARKGKKNGLSATRKRCGKKHGAAAKRKCWRAAGYGKK